MDFRLWVAFGSAVVSVARDSKNSVLVTAQRRRLHKTFPSKRTPPDHRRARKGPNPTCDAGEQSSCDRALAKTLTKQGNRGDRILAGRGKSSKHAHGFVLAGVTHELSIIESFPCDKHKAVSEHPCRDALYRRLRPGGRQRVPKVHEPACAPLSHAIPEH